jgi:hypothetical protein
MIRILIDVMDLAAARAENGRAPRPAACKQ